MKLSRFIVSVDSVIFGYADGQLHVPLFKRAANTREPYPDCWSLPGGPITEEETLEQACLRKLKQDLGLNAEYLEQLYTFGDPKRDPRDRAISVAYFALIKLPGCRIDADEARWIPTNQLPKSKWAFDHKQIAATALARLKAKVTYAPIGFNLLDDEFSIPQLQSLYEAILERPIDRRNFAKKIHSFNLLVPTQTVTQGRGRPTQLYRFDKAQYDRLEQEGFVFQI